MDLGLKGKVAVVAGASQGLGRAVAEELAAEGAHVAICARTAARVDAAAREISERTGNLVLSATADVTKPAEVEEFVNIAAERWGAVHIAVANAGGPPAKPFDATSLEEWQKAVDLTLMSSVHLALAVLPQMRAQKWGRLIFMTSVSIKQPIENLLLSNALRAGVAGLAKTLANECARDNVLVNVVCPGYTRTERLEELIAMIQRQRGVGREEVIRAWTSQIPMGRIGEPKELAALVAFLASERASYISGAAIAVDGGWVKGLL